MIKKIDKTSLVILAIFAFITIVAIALFITNIAAALEEESNTEAAVAPVNENSVEVIPEKETTVNDTSIKDNTEINGEVNQEISPNSLYGKGPHVLTLNA